MVSTRKKTYASVAETTRTPQKSILQEVAEVGASFNGQNEPAVLAAEGELQFGSLPAVDQHALRVAQGPRIHGSDLDELVATYENQDADDDEEERDESPTAGDSESGADAASSENVEDESAYILHSQGSLDWESSENGFVVPRITARKYKWLVPERMDTKYKFFPTWFDLSEDEDQLGPIPGSWVKKEEVDFQSAIEAFIEEVKISSAVPARSMAVIVEVPEEAAAKQSTKGKNVDAAERSAGFAAYLQEMQNSNAAREKHHKKSKDAKKAKERFSRSESQVPEGGWFRATTSKSGSPPAPPNTPSSSSDSSSSSDTSSSESAQSDPGSDTSSSGAYSGIRSRKLRDKLRDKRKLDEMRSMKKAMAGIKIKAPFIWDGKPVMDTFDHWTYEVDTWIELTALSDKLAMKLIVNFMSGTASKFFMDHVATNLKQWTIKDVYKALFDYCFPTDFKLRLRKRLMSAYQGKKTVRDFIRDIRSLAKRFPDVTERHLVQIFWDGADQYIRVKWLDRGMSPEESSLDKLVKWAMRFEKSKEALDKEQRDWRPKPEGRTWGRFKNRARGNEPWTPPDDNDKETSDTSTGRKTDKSAKNNQSAGKWAKDKQKEKSGKPKSFKPKWSPEEMDQMRAENKCFTCGEVGHQSRNCPDKHQAKAPKQKVSVGVARYDYLNSLGLDDLAKAKDESSVHTDSVRVEDSDELPDPSTLDKGTDKVWLRAPALEVCSYIKKLWMTAYPPDEAIAEGMVPDERFTVIEYGSTFEVTDWLKSQDPAQTALPPFRAVNHIIPIIDDTKAKKEVYLRSGRWRIATGTNAIPMLILKKTSAKAGEETYCPATRYGWNSA
ncbi:hypothetical protein B0H14DRAFT_3684971 [Mycena olivaceomarginata]|nr:hypothetical protein B0H14DRAFT_3684971 [Mycena olivaceomarginata]